MALTPLQLAEANAQAGVNISVPLQTRGWYFQSNAASTPASVRVARGSPVINFWYVDGQSVQMITVGSIALL